MRFPPHPDGSRASEAVKGARKRPPRPPLRQPEQLTKAERKALHAATHLGGTEAAKVHATPRGRLLEAGWVTQPAPRDDVEDDPLAAQLIATKAGRKALNAVLHEPARAGITVGVYLKHRDGLTTKSGRAVKEAGEVLDPATLSGYWAEEAARRKAATENARDQARRLARATRRAA